MNFSENVYRRIETVMISAVTSASGVHRLGSGGTGPDKRFADVACSHRPKESVEESGQ